MRFSELQYVAQTENSSQKTAHRKQLKEELSGELMLT
jgi:hypothetical protein